MTNDGTSKVQDNRRMYASGYRFHNTTDEKTNSIAQNNSLNIPGNNGSLKDSMTRKKITAYKVSSKNSNLEIPPSKPTSSMNIHKAPKPNPVSVIKRSSSTTNKEKESPKAPTPKSRKHLSESGKHEETKTKPKTIPKHPKSSKHSNSFNKDMLFDSINIPKGLTILEKCGVQDYYSRFGITKILKLPYKDCEKYFDTNEVQIFK